MFGDRCSCNFSDVDIFSKHLKTLCPTCTCTKEVCPQCDMVEHRRRSTCIQLGNSNSLLHLNPKHSMGLVYIMPISWGGAREINVGIYHIHGDHGVTGNETIWQVAGLSLSTIGRRLVSSSSATLLPEMLTICSMSPSSDAPLCLGGNLKILCRFGG